MIQTSTVYLLGGTAFLVYALQLVVNFQRAVKATGNFPGYRVLLCPIDIIGSVSPVHLNGISLQYHHYWKRKYSDFEFSGWDMFSTISAWPKPMTLFNVADPVTIKEIAASRTRFVKPTEIYIILDMFGRNVVVSESDEWKKHRRIANPAFSEPNNKLVWEESVKATMDLIDNEWSNAETLVIDDVTDVTVNLTLFIIGSAGFGKPISFRDDKNIPRGHKMSFKNALYHVSTGIIPLGLLPKWALGLTEDLRTIRTSQGELLKYMQEMIDERRDSEKKPERHDLFSALLDANSEDGDNGESKLTDSELIANIYVFLVAGHETSAHTLAFAFGLLALYPAEQELLFEHIMNVLPDKRLPTYEDMSSLTRVQAVLYETLRLFPPVLVVPKKAAEDTTLSVGNAKGERRTVPIPKDSIVYLNVAGLQYNPKVWKDPKEYRPQRFLEDWPRDGFIPFSAGARACLGRRFSETESIVILTIILQRYKIEVKEEPQFAGETFEQKKERILAAKQGVTITPIRLPLVFKRR